MILLCMHNNILSAKIKLLLPFEFLSFFFTLLNGYYDLFLNFVLRFTFFQGFITFYKFIAIQTLVSE